MSWRSIKLKEFMPKRVGSINPKKFQNEIFDLLSIPAYDQGKPDTTFGENIGSSKKCVEPNDVLLSRIVPHIRRCWVVPQKKKYRQIASGEWITFRSEDFYPPYVKYFLTSDLFHKQFMGTVAGVGGSLLRARPSQVENLLIPLPSLPEQKRIAAILDKADAIRRKRQQAIDLADQYLRSVFLDMFSDLFSTNGYVKSNKKPIKELVSIIDYRGKTPQKTDTGVTLITAKNVKKGFISKTPAEFISEDLYKSWMTRGYPLEGDVLFTTEAPLGNVAILGSYEKVCIGQRLISLRTKEALTPEYLLFALLSPLMRNLIAKRSTGSTVKGIRSKEFVQIQVPIPDIKLQKKFSEIYSKLSLNKTKQNKYLGNNESLFNALSQQAFAGKL